MKRFLNRKECEGREASARIEKILNLCDTLRPLRTLRLNISLIIGG
jgi:hypothetical protein